MWHSTACQLTAPREARLGAQGKAVWKEPCRSHMLLPTHAFQTRAPRSEPAPLLLLWLPNAHSWSWSASACTPCTLVLLCAEGRPLWLDGETDPHLSMTCPRALSNFTSHLSVPPAVHSCLPSPSLHPANHSLTTTLPQPPVSPESLFAGDSGKPVPTMPQGPTQGTRAPEEKLYVCAWWEMRPSAKPPTWFICRGQFSPHLQTHL